MWDSQRHILLIKRAESQWIYLVPIDMFSMWKMKNCIKLVDKPPPDFFQWVQVLRYDLADKRFASASPAMKRHHQGFCWPFDFGIHTQCFQNHMGGKVLPKDFLFQNHFQSWGSKGGLLSVSTSLSLPSCAIAEWSMGRKFILTMPSLNQALDGCS